MKITMQRERLRHQPRLKANMAVAHLALDLRARDECRDRIDHQHVDRVRSDQRVDDLERLFTGIGLRNDQLVDVDAELLGIDRVERVFGVDERSGAAALLRLGDDVQRERGLARGFGAVDLDHAAARQAADAERDVEPERPGRDHLDLHRLLRPKLHRRALAEGAVDLCEGGVERLLPVGGCGSHAGVDHFQIGSHQKLPSLEQARGRINALGCVYRVCSQGTREERSGYG
jgi:hypothetical protein